MERNGRALGWTVTPPKMCFRQHLLASGSTAAGDRPAEDRPAGGQASRGRAVWDVAESSTYSENHLFSHYRNMSFL